MLDILAANSLVVKGDHVLLAVSGGLDSVAMLHLLLELRPKLNLKLGVIHLNHGLRGPEAIADQEFVSALSATHGLPFYTKTENVKDFARLEHFSLEEAGRVVRYAFFEETLQKTGADKLATGHTANDQAETVIDHFLRGAGSAGLGGMRESRADFIRPLLRISRKQLEEYANETGLQIREDSSNSDLTFKRNRIRQELLPYLRDNLNNNIVNGLVRTAGIFQEIEDFLVEQGKNALEIVLISGKKKDIIIVDIQPFLAYTTLIQKYVIYECYSRLEIKHSRIDYAFMQELLQLINRGRVGSRSILDDRFELLVDHDGLVFKRRGPCLASKVTVFLDKTDHFKYRNYLFHWSVDDTLGQTGFTRDLCIEYFDYDKTGPQLSLRSYLPGDFFLPLNLGGRKKVADFFSDLKVPLRLRSEIPILENSDGILWVCGLRMDDRFKVTEKTQRILRMAVTESP